MNISKPRSISFQFCFFRHQHKMRSQYRCSVILILFLNFSTRILHASALRIEKCSTLLTNNLPGTVFDATIDTELTWNKANNVASASEIKVILRAYTWTEVNDFNFNITSMKEVRIQRFIEYKRNGFEDIVKPYCSLSFIYDHNASSVVPFNLENDIIVHTEDCIEKAICKIDPEDHKLGDDIHVISTSRHETLNTITQETVNSLMDLVLDKGQHSLIREKQLLINIPEIDVSAYSIKFSSSGGILDILKYIKRDGDLSFEREGHRYIVDTVVRSTGGYAELNDVSLSSKLGNFVKGRIPVDVNNTVVRVRVALDYNHTPCKISATDVTIDLAPEQYDFSTLKIEAFGFEVSNAESVLSTLSLKSMTVSAINNKLADLVKSLVDGLECEGYRNMLFTLKT